MAVKVYKQGVNVCIEGYSTDIPLYFIPTHQTRLDISETSVTITDTYPSSIDRFVIPLSELKDKDEVAITVKADAIEYLSEFIGKSYGGSNDEISIASILDKAVDNDITYVEAQDAQSVGVGEIYQIIYKDIDDNILMKTTFSYNSEDKKSNFSHTFPPFV